MSIRRQFFILSTIIVTVPILCALFVFIHNYVNSSDRILIAGYKEIRKMDSGQFSYNEWNTLLQTLESLPSDVQAALLSEDNTVLISSISNFKVNKQIAPREMWEIVNSESDKYFYQFTSPPMDNHKLTLLTRTLRTNKDPKKSRHLGFIILFGIVIFVLICIILIVFISSTISKSILVLENTTQKIADGHLETEIETSKDYTKSNEIISTLESLEKMRISLLEAQNRKNKFIMGISHDLRTPVAVIKGYTEAIKDGIITEQKDIQDSLELIETETSHLENMINTLLSFMKLNDNELRKKLTESSITKVIKTFEKESKFTATVFNRNIISDIKLDDDIYIPLDEQLALRAFQNLFSNAIRYTNDGDTIKILSYIEDNNIYLKVIDSGIGISEEDLTNIFDLFYRATNSRREEGMGIGLSIVKNIIDTHGWKIDVKSKLGSGTTFTIIIPILQSKSL